MCDCSCVALLYDAGEKNSTGCKRMHLSPTGTNWARKMHVPLPLYNSFIFLWLPLKTSCRKRSDIVLMMENRVNFCICSSLQKEELFTYIEWIIYCWCSWLFPPNHSYTVFSISINCNNFQRRVGLIVKKFRSHRRAETTVIQCRWES